ncbi:MAG: DUF1326 domain-containing protein [Armatimonadetes bacterium]|nr:DUF1326 domain-containing protein [Armatimonadota bacterium]
MNSKIFATILAAGVLGGASARAATPTGDYVEARTASVFAGACHYSGEYVADGREAVMAWHFKAGDWHGVSLAGLSAVAVVRADNNLAEPTAHRATALFVDAKGTPAQQKALADALTARYASGFGKVASVGAASIAFRHTAGGYRVSAPQVAALSVDALPNRECCKQPNLVWYKPLAPITDRRVGYTQTASCTARTGGDAWTRGNENSAFYGTFAL